MKRRSFHSRRPTQKNGHQPSKALSFRSRAENECVVYHDGHERQMEPCQHHELFDMTHISGDAMDEDSPQRNLIERKELSLRAGDDSLYKDALPLKNLWKNVPKTKRILFSKKPSRQTSCDATFQWLFSVLSQSPALCALMEDIDSEGWAVMISQDTQHSYQIDIEHNVIILPALMKKSYSGHNLLLNTIRALRDIWYEDHHFDLYERLAPAEWLKWEKIRSADIESFAVFVAWELRIAGEQDTWRALMGEDIGDMAIVFQAVEERKTDLNSYENNLLHVFRQWFMTKDRVDDSDTATLAMLDHAFLDTDRADPFGTERLSAHDVEARLPYLKNVEQMLSSPDFCAIQDEINETHFFHLMNDLETIHVEGVRFRDKDLAAKIFPQD